MTKRLNQRCKEYPLFGDLFLLKVSLEALKSYLVLRRSLTASIFRSFTKQSKAWGTGNLEASGINWRKRARQVIVTPPESIIGQ
jgi:hypothetical protein